VTAGVFGGCMRRAWWRVGPRSATALGVQASTCYKLSHAYSLPFGFGLRRGLQ
jgi:hypothetical protein